MKTPEKPTTLARRRVLAVLLGSLSLAPIHAAAYLPQERTVEGVLERHLPGEDIVIIAGERYRLHPRAPRPAPPGRGHQDGSQPVIGSRVVARIVKGRIVHMERAQ
ncbi:hypothetical protein TK90_0209 [Thioalkalivibrio sp. K90mix]|uniref:hypothetical protein n=1 Tax=Thioalkalivibrio sp. (strain K90mix) TaxID=396595 RepID=UPI000195A38C|nr:hypothetical protein [Thioalkalivibrio sp. K90mix]ADC70724.1 hypothetical protein TK90_0209 [Thioalkalivibrio sp. K90mix]